jgi:23S rRNA (uracil1939-C5)-methyltransferase
VTSPENDPTILELTLTDIALDGRSIAFDGDGRKIFVPYTIPGETITARIVDEGDDSANAEGLTILDPSADRVLPQCPHFGQEQCGGCQWQHMTYEAQLALKTDIIATQLTEEGGFDDPPIQFALASPDEWNYATHTTLLPLLDGRLGFLGTDGQTIIPISECHVIRPELLELADELNLSLETLESVQLHASATGRPMLVLQTSDDEPPELESTVSASLNFILSHREPFNMIGDTHITQRIFDRIFRVTAGVDSRANVAQIEQLVEVVMNYLNLQGDEAVLDLYGGIGIFSAFVAPLVNLVTYIDSYPPAATDAEANLEDLDNVDIIEGRTDTVLWEIANSDEHENYAAAITDPPANGMNFKAIQALAKLKIPMVVYVGQNPAIFARDAKLLVKEARYRLVDVQPIDFAPQTAAIECVGLFRRR